MCRRLVCVSCNFCLQSDLYDSQNQELQFVQFTFTSKLSPALPSAPLFAGEIGSRLTQSDASQSTHDGATAVKQRISFKPLNSNYITSRETFDIRLFSLNSDYLSNRKHGLHSRRSPLRQGRCRVHQQARRQAPRGEPGLQQRQGDPRLVSICLDGNKTMFDPG